MRKLFDEIHFSIHSVLVKRLHDFDLKKGFYRWVCKGFSELDDAEEYDGYLEILWLESPVSKTDFPDGIEWSDVRDYAEGIPLRIKSLSQTENEELKILRMETAEILFDRFLHEGLNDDQKVKIEDAWNEVFGEFSDVDYDGFDYDLDGFSRIYNGKKFVLHEQQKKGVAFLCSKGNGLLAYDVGVGKTATGIVAAVWQMQHGKCKRPVIIVPKAADTKWVHDIKELFPNIKLNELENLNRDIISELRKGMSCANDKNEYLIKENTLSICTSEACEKICFSENSREFLKESFNCIISENKQDEYLSFSDSELVTNDQYVFAEELGIDLLLVDEAHRYKNLIRKVSGCGHSEFSKLGFGEASVRAVKMFALTEYIHHVANGKNVFFLSATPFTNSPMEIYSMLLYVGGDEVRRIGYENINDFLNEFAEIKIEWSVNNRNQVVRKTVMKNFRSLDALQRLIQNYIDKVDAEDAKIKRPDKETHVVKIEMTDLQKSVYEYEINRISHTNLLGVIFEGMNAMRMLMISPTLVKCKDDKIKIPDLGEFVSSSPKLRVVCCTVSQIYRERPDCGQIIYLPRGVKESALVKQYLVKEGIPEDAVGMISSSTTESRKNKITKAFNNPDEELKILIGSETISEGVDLNGNTLVLYNCMLGWNPTEPIQVEGRLWRQGNRQKKVHVVYPLMYNSIDSLIYQKHDEKASRIDALWSYRGDKINVEEINPEELKFDLIKSPEMKAELMMEKEAVLLRRKLKIIEETRENIALAECKIKEIMDEIFLIEKEILQTKQYVENSKSGEFNWFSDTISQLASVKEKELAKDLENKKKSLDRLKEKFLKKLRKIGGIVASDFNRKELLDNLKKQENDINKELSKIKGKKEKFIQIYKAQYEAESKTQINSVEAIVEQIVADILQTK